MTKLRRPRFAFSPYAGHSHWSPIQRAKGATGVKTAHKVLALIEKLEDHDDVQTVTSNAEIAAPVLVVEKNGTFFRAH